MLRSTFIIFLAGWTLRFLIDKPPAGQLGLPKVSDSMIDNFQQSFDMLKAGHLDMAYVFIWDAHYLLLSLLGGLLLSVAVGLISDQLGRRRMRKLVLPSIRKKPASPDEPEHPGEEAASREE